MCFQLLTTCVSNFPLGNQHFQAGFAQQNLKDFKILFHSLHHLSVLEGAEALSQSVSLYVVPSPFAPKECTVNGCVLAWNPSHQLFQSDAPMLWSWMLKFAFSRIWWPGQVLLWGEVPAELLTKMAFQRTLEFVSESLPGMMIYFHLKVENDPNSPDFY